MAWMYTGEVGDRTSEGQAVGVYLCIHRPVLLLQPESVAV